MRKVLAVLGLLALAGCSSKASGAGTSAAPTPSITAATTDTVATSAATSSAPTATVAQVASAFAGGVPAVKDAAARIADCSIVYDPSDFTCTLGRTTYAITVETLAVTLDGAIDPTSHVYIGAPPAELAPLIKQSDDSFAGLKSATAKLASACTAAASAKCAQASLTWSTAKSDVTSAIAGWSPYTH